jgi:hypothetical protein
MQVMASPRRGARGNAEFLVHCRHGRSNAVVDDALDRAVAEAHVASPPGGSAEPEEDE